MSNLDKLLHDIKKCDICNKYLAHGVRPILQINSKAKILIAGQAPGRKAHLSGIPFDDASGDRLRDWMGISKVTFYSAEKIAILPMGFCYPGTGGNGDLPPRRECSETWHHRLLDQLPNIEMTIILGSYAQKYYLKNPKTSLTELVRSWQKFWPDKIPLPHPSPRNNIWLRKNPWFEIEVLPKFKTRVNEILK